MPHDLFETVTHPPTHVGGRSGVTLSLAAHAAAIAVIVVVPLIATDVLPRPDSAITLIIPGTGLPPEPPRPVAPAASPATASPTAASIPLDAPREIAPEPVARPPVDLGEPAPGAIFPGGAGGTGDDGRVVGLPPPPLPPAPIVMREPVRVGGPVAAPTKIHDVQPAYPAIARSAGIEGTVILQATIGLDGSVENLQVLRSVPLLDEAAMSAVRQWRYTPPRLNGQPVAVIMTVTVSFRLR